MKKILVTLICAASCAMLAARGIDDDIAIKVEGGILYGSLVLPESDDPTPVVLFIAGSGPTDRNGNSSIHARPYQTKMMARALYDAGIASISYDKRLFGAEKDLTFDLYIDDALAWVEKLAQNERFSEIIIVGHSEGATIGALAAIRNPKISRVVYLCGMTEGMSTTMKKQYQAREEEGLISYAKTACEILDSLQQGFTVKNPPQELAVTFRPTVQPYLISSMKYLPEEYIAEVPVPMLMIHGTTDIQIPPDGQKALAATNPKARAVTIKDMNHVLKRTEATNLQGQAQYYASPGFPLHEELMPLIIDFINE